MLRAGEIFNIDVHRNFCNDKDIKATEEMEDISLDFLQLASFGKPERKLPQIGGNFPKEVFPAADV
jgi:hypothetical protein